MTQLPSNLRADLIATGHIRADQWPEEQGNTGHWLMNALLGWAALIGAMFFFGAIMTISAALFYSLVKDLVLLLYGGAFLALALAMDRATVKPGIVSTVVVRMATALMVAGVSLVCFYFIEVAKANFQLGAAIATVLFAGAFFAYRQAAARVWATFFFFVALSFALGKHAGAVLGGNDVPRFTLFIAAATLAALSISEPAYARHSGKIAPAIDGSSMALLTLAITLALPRIFVARDSGISQAPLAWQDLLFSWIAIAAPLMAWIGSQCARRSASVWVLPAATVALICLIPAPELLCVTLVAVIAYERRQTGLLWLCAPLALAAVGVVYYGWQTTLLVKSLSMLAASAACLGVALLTRSGK